MNLQTYIEMLNESEMHICNNLKHISHSEIILQVYCTRNASPFILRKCITINYQNKIVYVMFYLHVFR